MRGHARTGDAPPGPHTGYRIVTRSAQDAPATLPAEAQGWTVPQVDATPAPEIAVLFANSVLSK